MKPHSGWMLESLMREQFLRHNSRQKNKMKKNSFKKTLQMFLIPKALTSTQRFIFLLSLPHHFSCDKYKIVKINATFFRCSDQDGSQDAETVERRR